MNRMKRAVSLLAVVAVLAFLPGTGGVMAQSGGPVTGQGALGTAFTYQGLLKDGSGNQITSTCDFQFGLWDAATVGAQVGTTTTVSSVPVTNGYFTVSLDFGSGRFDGNARWLATQVQCTGDSSPTLFNQRQALTAAPYAFFALNADSLGGQPAAAFQQHYQNVLVVARSGGDFTSISAALATISSASQTNPYLIKVAPGVYTDTFTMKSWVDIEGSGELTTKITQPGSTSIFAGTVLGANNAELRFLTVENTGGNANAIAIYNGHAAPRLTHVTLTASGGGTFNLGVYNNYGSPAMTNVTTVVSGTSGTSYGVYNFSASPTMTVISATISGGASSINYGVDNDNSSPTMTNVSASASGGLADYGVSNTSSSPTMTNVSVNASGGSNVNYGVSNSSSSPTMTNVSASASGGSYNYAVDNFRSSPTMTDVTANASGGASSTNYGVDNESSASPTMFNVTTVVSGTASTNSGVYNTNGGLPAMTNVTAIVSGAYSTNCGVCNSVISPTMTNMTIVVTGTSSMNYGVFNTASSPTITNVTASASAGTKNYGMLNNSSSVSIERSAITGSNDGLHNVSGSTTISYTVTVNNSVLSGANSTIYQDNSYTTQVGASRFATPAGAFGGVLVCIYSYKSDYTALSGTCQ